MTLTKSLLLGSAATLMVVAGAQAADLPTKKGAPAAEYVKVCQVGSIAGFIIPGSDTCLKISGYVNAQIAVGNVSEERQVYYNDVPGGGSDFLRKDAKYVSDIGFSTRGQVNFDAVTNTAMGPLLAHIEIQANSGTGFDPLGNGAVLNAGYVQWAGITAGKHGSFYDYLAGGDTWKDFFSPDHSGTPTNLLAYTASFGGGFSATLSLEQNDSRTGVNIPWLYYNGTSTTAGTYTASGTALGVRAPDIIAALDVSQSWGGAHLAGVAHNIRVESSYSYDVDTWGYGVIGGVTFNLPMLSPGSKIAFQGAYAHGAIAYSGATSPAWGEQDQGFNTNGNGTLFPMADGVFNYGSGQFNLSNAWSAAAQLTWKLSPNFEIDPELAYASVDYGSSAANSWYWLLSQKATAWWFGAVFDWSPVKNLDFALDVVYESSHQSAPVAWSTNSATPWKADSDGFNARLHVVRSF
jgi:hypothetical protein